MISSNTTSKKIISTLLVIFILLPNVLFILPQKAIAQEEAVTVPVSDIGKPAVVTAKSSFWSRILNGTTAAKTSVSAGTDLKQWALKIAEEALRNLAKKFLQKLTESTVNWINEGFHGAPLFVENPKSFFKDIAKYEIKTLVSRIGYDNRNFPFGKGFIMSAIQGYKNTFERNAQYSLSKVISDQQFLNNYRNDFNVGGWDGFLLNTQFPQNNPIGSQLMYSDYLASKLPEVDTAKNKIQKTLEQGQGFLSPQTCPSNPKYNNAVNEFKRPTFKPTTPPPVYQDCSQYEEEGNTADLAICERANAALEEAYNLDVGSERLLWNEKNFCPGGLVATTPGSVVANQIMTATSSAFRQGELGMAMGNSLSAIFDALLNQFMSKGLTAIKSKIYDKPKEGDRDDFSYYGNTFGDVQTTNSGTKFIWSQIKDPVNDIDKLEYDGTKFIDKEGLKEPADPLSCPAGQTGTPPNCIKVLPTSCDLGDGTLRPIPECNPTIN